MGFLLKLPTLKYQNSLKETIEYNKKQNIVKVTKSRQIPTLEN